MNSAIDYSSLPVQRPMTPTRRKLQLALLLLAGLLLVTRPFITFKQHPLNDALLGLVPFIIVVLLALQLRARREISKQERQQQEAVRVFSERNGWQFEGPKLLANPLLPNQNPGGSSSQQYYRVSGTIGSQAFELCAAGNQTVLRTQGALSSTLVAPGTQTVSDSGWNYVSMHGVAANVDDMKALLQPLLGAPSS